MKETSFIKQNIDKWKSFEEVTASKNDASPDELATLYIEVTDDLSYAQTYYPQSNITSYLNQLAGTLHFKIHHNKKEKGRFKRYWKEDLPYAISQAHRQLLYSFLVFFFSALIGVVSTLEDETFPRLILGNEYVDVTIQNIKKGKSMDIYASSDSVPMFFYIVSRNIGVSFKTFMWGGFPWFFLLAGGTAYLLFVNGVMLGAFQTFFYKYKLLGYTSSVIWLHGTLEISAIIIAGGAGFILASSLLYPRTLPRMQSFRKGAKHGSKIIIGLVPVFLLAGFIESFITRYADMPLIFKIFIILSSLSFVFFYFIWLPLKVKAKKEKEALTSKPRPVVIL